MTRAASTRSPTVTRGALFAGIVILGLANGVSETVWRSVAENGVWRATFATFDISLILWLACLALPPMALKLPPRTPGRGDFVISAIALMLIMVPVAHASWLALTMVALWIGWDARHARDGQAMRLAATLIATANVAFWGRLVLNSSGSLLLKIDAAIIATATGQPRIGNVIMTAGGRGSLWIAPYCSSLTNVSLAVLASVLAVNWHDLRWTGGQVARCVGAAAAVMLINDVRIAAMVLRPDQYFFIHGAPGSIAANLASVAAIAGIVLPGIPAMRDQAVPA